jgi:hypothetical protein
MTMTDAELLEVETDCGWSGYWSGPLPTFCPGCGVRIEGSKDDD